MPRRILRFEDAEAVAAHAADEFIRRAESAIAARGVFRVALAGGSTPRRTYELLALGDRESQVEWQAVQIFFGDERSVPPEHSDSNYRTALEALLGKVDLRPESIHRMEGERPDLEQAAKAYEEILERAFEMKLPAWPRFDLIMLGMGGDGHTASLFPGTRALSVDSSWVVANEVPQLSTRRITFTVPLLNAARCVMFTVAGADKETRVADVLEGPRDPNRLPSQFVAPRDGDLLWLIDAAAAGALKDQPVEPVERRSPA